MGRRILNYFRRILARHVCSPEIMHALSDDLAECACGRTFTAAEVEAMIKNEEE